MLRVFQVTNPGGKPWRNLLFHANEVLSAVIPAITPRVPVFILDEAQFYKLFPSQNEDNSDYLGVYVHDFDTSSLLPLIPTGKQKPNGKVPEGKCNAIFLCYDRIKATASKIGISVEYLMSKVLIHEFGHAYMDLFAPASFTYADPIYKANEESWANVFTLNVIETYISRIGFCRIEGFDDFFVVVKDFISKQPREYAIGRFIWECGIVEYDYWGYNKEKEDIWNKWYSFAEKEYIANGFVNVSKSGMNMKEMWATIKNEIMMTNKL